MASLHLFVNFIEFIRELTQCMGNMSVPVLVENLSGQFLCLLFTFFLLKDLVIE